jgi:signal transduction histidine kinase/CheY-like chemotaxis protein
MGVIERTPMTDTEGQPAGRILIVDDEAGVVAALTKLLRRQGFETCGCSTGSEALGALRQRDYDVLLSDLMMPDMDGIMLLRSALAIDPNLIGIVMTGNSDIHTAVEAIRSGAFDYVTKPLQLSFLLPILSRALTVRRLRTENVQLREAVAVYGLSMAVISSLDVETILTQTAEAALQTCRADEVSIILPQEGKDEGYIAVVRGGNREYLVGQVVPFAQSIVGWIMHSYKPLILNGTVRDPRFTPVCSREDIRSAIAFPLVARQQVVGILTLNATLRSRSFTQSDLKTLSVLAGIAAPALLNTQLYGRMEEEMQISKSLAHVGHKLIASLDTAELLVRLCQVVSEVLQCQCSLTLVPHESGEDFVCTAGWGVSPEQWETLRILRIPRAVLASVLDQVREKTFMHMQVADMQVSPITAAWTHLGIAEVLWIALRRGNEITGLQVACFSQGEGTSRSHNERVAQRAAQLASFALNNARLFAQLKRESSIKSDFLAMMSHEFRTPLHIIQGYLDLLEDGTFGPLTPEQHRPLQQMRKSAVSLLELVTSTLDVRKLLHGRLPLTITEIEVPALIAEFQREVENLHLEKLEVRIEWQVAPEVPVIHSDRAKLKLVLRKLFHNAIKFTEAGSVTVGVTAHEHGVEFRVSDTGIGITPEQLPNIFEMFEQGDNSDTRRYGGLGLGLYIVRRMLDLLGGTVTVDSEVGRGSTFRVWIPQMHTQDSGVVPQHCWQEQIGA